LSLPTGNNDITGLAGGTIDGQLVAVINLSATNTVRFLHQNPGSLAQNQFVNINAAPVGGSIFQAVAYVYDLTAQVWRCLTEQ
jgi:hypothetical protein